MAGIGFRLRKLLDQESYLATMQAYLYSALISSGPWLITIIVIAVLGMLQTESAYPFEDVATFRLTIIYAYAFSLIVVGILQMPLTRYLSDLLFSRDLGLYLPTYVAALFVVGVVQAGIGATAVLLLSDWGIIFGFHAVLLYVTVSFIWIAMIFITTVKDYHSVSLAFLLGGVVSVVAGIQLGEARGSEGYVVGYTLGQIFIFLYLTVRIAVEFDSDQVISFDFLRYVWQYPTLTVVGVGYNLAIWADKFVFWFGPTGTRVEAFMFSSDVYDVPMFLAYLTIVPAMSLFLIRIETDFYHRYKAYYGAIVGKQSLAAILREKTAMVDSMRASIGRLLKVQGTLSLLCILAVPHLIDVLPLNWLHMNILRVGILAAFLHVLLLLLNIGLLYFELRREAMAITLLLLLTNALFSWWSLAGGLAWYGYGYLGACFVTLVVGVLLLDHRIRNLEYITFVTQPVR